MYIGNCSFEPKLIFYLLLFQLFFMVFKIVYDGYSYTNSNRLRETRQLHILYVQLYFSNILYARIYQNLTSDNRITDKGNFFRFHCLFMFFFFYPRCRFVMFGSRGRPVLLNTDYVE